ncbi:pepsin/retropepsin-like aspartic protease family protein [Ulvibacter antarcticus]|uniref:Aspartyl protease n=1 Tax=Ulvibacter antarcticus TaxID=442714 RepID=A0A3L9YDB9_9FLAO|nr:hypothetical protein [Ulvibacter antarcticus]RMA58651.1 hypothetical protein BXY75_2025 [Ulvibacter antarcticus]
MSRFIMVIAFILLHSSLRAGIKPVIPYFDDGSIVFTEAEILNEYTARIPFKLVDRLIVVEAALLNQKGDFIIDTGSEALLLNEVHFPSEYPFLTPTKQASGVIDIIDNVKERKLQEFLLHDFVLKNAHSEIIDLSHIEKSKKIHLLGIIGFSILKDYEVFIDLHLNQITLTKVDKYGNKYDKKVYSEKITDSIPFKLNGHTITLKAMVNDITVNFGLDSAAEFNQLNKRINKKVIRSFFPKGRILLTGASNKKIEVITGRLFGVKLSENVYFGPMNTVLTNLNKMNEAFGTNLDGVLGYEFFQQKRTIINYQKEKLFFINYPLNRQ